MNLASIFGVFFLTGWKINDILDLTLDQFFFICESEMQTIAVFFGNQKGQGTKDGQRVKIKNLTSAQAINKYIEDE